MQKICSKRKKVFVGILIFLVFLSQDFNIRAGKIRCMLVSCAYHAPKVALRKTKTYMYIYIYIYILEKIVEVKPQAEVLAFGAYMFESLQSFNNSQVKAYCMSNLRVICQNCRTSAIIICNEAAFIAKRAVKSI